MIQISCIFRRSRSVKKPDKAGMFCLKLSERVDTGLYKNTNIITGIKSRTGKITPEIRQKLIRFIRLTYCIVENLASSGKPFNRMDVMKQLRLAINNDSSMASIIEQAGTNSPIRSDLVRLGNEFKGDFQFDHRLESGQAIADSDTIGRFLIKKSKDFKNEGKSSSARSYSSAYSSLDKFCKGKHIRISDIDRQFLHQYTQWLIESGVSESTQSFYLRTLRAAINHAAEEKGLIIDPNLFENINTKVGYPKKDDSKIYELSLTQLRKIASLDLHYDSELELIRDMFMLGFYCHGLELVDALNLKKSNISGNWLRFNRRKSGMIREIELIIAASNIIHKYNDTSLVYIFPLLEKYKGRNYYTISEIVRTKMKEIGKKINVNSLTFGSNIKAWNQIINNLNVSEFLNIKTR